MTNIKDEKLLNDDEIVDFVIRGYHVVRPNIPATFHQQILSELDSLTMNPGDEISTIVPNIDIIYGHPQVTGALRSLLGNKFRKVTHRHCHKNYPGSRSQRWHQDGLPNPVLPEGQKRVPDNIKTLLAMYYPQAVKKNMGPTAIIPGSHFFNNAPDLMASQGNFRDQFIGTVEAGTVIILHYDIWHAGTANTSDKTRYMIKYLFERTDNPTNPSWDHNPENNTHILDRLDREHATILQPSMFQKSKYLRTKMWNNLAGESALKFQYYDKWVGSWPKP